MVVGISTKTKSEFKRLGAYQLVCGIVGISFIVIQLVKTNVLFASSNFNFLPSILLNGFSVLCGVLCIRLHRQSLNYSHVCQYMQTFSLVIPGLIYQFSAGPYITMGFQAPGNALLYFDAGWSSTFLIFGSSLESTQFYINFVAIIFVIWIHFLKRIVQDEQEMEIVDRLGST